MASADPAPPAIEWITPGADRPVGTPPGAPNAPRRRWAVPAAGVAGALVVVSVAMGLGAPHVDGEAGIVPPTTVAPAPTTVAATAETVPGAPLLGRESGVVLYSLLSQAGRTWVARVDLDSGRLEPVAEEVGSGQLAYLAPGQALLVSYDGGGSWRLWGTDRERLEPEGPPIARGPGRLWFLGEDGASALRLDLVSRQVTTVPVPDAAQVLAEDGVGGLLAYVEGQGTLRVHPGPIERVDPGRVLSASAAGLVVQRCDADGCRIVWRPSRGDERVVLDGPGARSTAAALAPNGRRVALSTAGEGAGRTVEVVDLVTGERTEVASGASTFVPGGYVALSAPVSWSPDGRWFALLGGDGIDVWDADLQRLVELDLRGRAAGVVSLTLA